MKTWRSDDLAGLYARLLAGGVSFVVIGGQAINLWSEHYRSVGRLPKDTWEALLPFTSHDLDLLGGRIEAVAAAEALGVEPILFDPASRQVVPNAATLYVPLAGDEIVVQFLHTPLGARREEIRTTARLLQWQELSLQVMHPILCAESKLECLYQLDQRGRQDVRHLRLALLCVQELLRDLVGAGDERAILGIFERLAGVAAEEPGLRLHAEHAIRFEEALELPELRRGSGSLRKLSAFYEKRYPQLAQRILSRRARYAQIATRDSRSS